jgi:hypothetical protein
MAYVPHREAIHNKHKEVLHEWQTKWEQQSEIEMTELCNELFFFPFSFFFPAVKVAQQHNKCILP